MEDQGNEDRSRRGWLLSVVSGAILLVGCAVAAYLVAHLVDLVRPGTLLRGRDFRPTAIMAAAFIAAAGCWWSLARGHGWMEMLASLALIEVLLGGLIFFFSGSAAIDSFFLDWFLGVNLYLGLPWLIAIGSGLVKAWRYG